MRDFFRHTKYSRSEFFARRQRNAPCVAPPGADVTKYVYSRLMISILRTIRHLCHSLLTVLPNSAVGAARKFPTEDGSLPPTLCRCVTEHTPHEIIKLWLQAVYANSIILAVLLHLEVCQELDEARDAFEVALQRLVVLFQGSSQTSQSIARFMTTKRT